MNTTDLLNRIFNPVRHPIWVEEYFEGKPVYWNDHLTEEEIKEAEEYIKKHGLKLEQGRNGAWEREYRKGEYISQIAKWYNTTYARIRKELEDKGYQINDEENWLKKLESGVSLKKIADEYRLNYKIISRLLRVKYGNEIIDGLLNKKSSYKHLGPEWLRLYKEGWIIAEIARHYNVQAATVRKYIKHE
ncbi:helix-turn-helix domain-containing protein [Priestia koreensis]|uniref:helix-turn-helix domain-containing protein n=1 Tax=Priestia koreensis TaxID=284581 RepID=UPI00203E3F2B|nr:helix-turn-helix domain-containing protein [Priestia koreensis]MCM3006315.1 helix-turn-helix domain-containing protein [Priestia koreensis]